MRRTALIALSTLLAVSLVATPASARQQETADPNQVTDLTAQQAHGYATLAWQPVPDATDYQIECTTVRGPLACAGNTPEPINLGLTNTVHGPRTDQCAAL